MKKRKNFLLRTLVIMLLIIGSFGVGRNSKPEQAEELEKHYQNWYFIGVLHTLKSILNGDAYNSDEIMNFIEKKPSLEEEKELIEEILKDIPISFLEDLPTL